MSPARARPVPALRRSTEQRLVPQRPALLVRVDLEDDPEAQCGDLLGETLAVEPVGIHDPVEVHPLIGNKTSHIVCEGNVQLDPPVTWLEPSALEEQDPVTVLWVDDIDLDMRHEREV